MTTYRIHVHTAPPEATETRRRKYIYLICYLQLYHDAVIDELWRGAAARRDECIIIEYHTVNDRNF